MQKNEKQNMRKVNIRLLTFLTQLSESIHYYKKNINTILQPSIIKKSSHSKMFRKLFTRSQTLYPQFRNLTYQHMYPSFMNELANNIYYTPKIQKITYSDQLVRYMAFLSRKKLIKPNDMRQFTQNLLTQFGNVYPKVGLEDQKFGFQKNYKIQQQQNCPYHGTVDYMVYLNNKHFFPMLFFDNNINKFSGPALAMSNMFMKSKLRQQPRTSGYSLLTNGQQWILYKVYRSLKLQKSVIYEAKNNKFKKIYDDYQMVSVLLGLVDCCLDAQRPQVETLKIAYDFIDQQRFQIQAKQGEKINNSPAGGLLQKYYEKKKQWESK